MEKHPFNQGQFVGRHLELEILREFLGLKGRGFLHVRGRRRIGKSWFLKKAALETPGSFYYQGLDDVSGMDQRKIFAKSWDEFTGEEMLGKIKSSGLHWREIFLEIQRYVTVRKKPVIIILDEIQWLAKRRSGFLGQLKEAWAHWESSGLIKVIISGSSHRFFQDEKSEETKVLRGLRTFADIYLEGFSLGELKKYFFKRWSDEEICLTYMMTGGVPYYVKALDASKSCIRSLNEAFFTKKGIFLNEVEEILRLEFNSASVETIKRILSQLGQEGKTMANICRGRDLHLHEITVRGIIEKLVNYNIVFEKRKHGTKPKLNKSGIKYVMKDCFLNFYFQVLRKHEKQIKRNQRENLLGKEIITSKGYYIENFSGKAFELLIELVLKGCQKTGRINGMIEKMNLEDLDFEVHHYWEEKKTGVDLVILAPQAREAKILEIKWVSRKANGEQEFIEQVLNKEYSPPRRYRLDYYLAISGGWTDSFQRKAQREDVGLIGLSDLF